MQIIYKTDEFSFYLFLTYFFGHACDMPKFPGQQWQCWIHHQYWGARELHFLKKFYEIGFVWSKTAQVIKAVWFPT